MTTTEQLASFVAGLEPAGLDGSLLASLRMHVLDTIGAAYAGSRVSDTPPVRDLVVSLGPPGPALALGHELRASVPLAALLGCVTVRCTEVDDIHLASCVTPGSVVVPAAIAAASAAGRTDDARFVAACLAGYELMLRFGLAADGPNILYKGLWPTYLAAGFGTAATVGTLLGLSAGELAHAFAIVATLTTATVGGRVSGLTSRWFILGCAVQSAVTATLAAARGMQGDLTLLDGRWSEITGIELERERLIGGLGERFHLAETSFKPICAAKQTIAAVDALRGLLSGGRIATGDVRRILVEVPGAYKAMIDQPAMPRNRLASISNVRYQLALAALAPDALLDVTRDDVRVDDRLAAFAQTIDVEADEQLDPLYPAQWPARVTVTLASGERVVGDVRRALGDPGTAFGLPEIEQKFGRVAPTVGAGRARALAGACSTLGEPGSVQALLALLAAAPG
jgi:2-methylcitrate dehydratase PrpD